MPEQRLQTPVYCCWVRVQRVFVLSTAPAGYVVSVQLAANAGGL